MIKIYGHPATSAGRCYWMLEEVGAQYEQVSIEMRKKEHKSPAFLALNPNGKVPVLQDGSLTLWESTAINNYLAERYKPELLGPTLEDRAKCHQWTIWSMAEYQKPMIDLFIQLVFVPEEKRDEKIVEASKTKIAPLNSLLNEVLREKNYLVTEDFTIADLNVASVARINKHVGIDISRLTHLDTWLNKVLERPASLKVDSLSQKR